MDSETQRVRLGTEILREVSRTFYLSIRILPSAVREPVGLAYLLARSTDTIADTASVDGEVKRAFLERLEARIDGESDTDLVADLEEQFCPLQSHEGERILLERTDDCIEWLGALESGERSLIRRALGHIVHGQKLDIERFDIGPSESKGSMQALKSACELDEYTYLVAGCVGEFWTDVCALKLGSKFCKEENLDEMRRLGVDYGQGLQLLNILRDLRSDMRDGRCYLPVLPGKDDDVDAVMIAFRDWLAVCGKKLASGVRYTEMVTNTRVRLATALPLFLAVKTWHLLNNASWEDLEEKVKVGRREVKKTALRGTVAALMGGEGIRDYYQKLLDQ